MADVNKPANPLTTVAGLGGALGGFLLAKYSGANLLIPGAAALVVGAITIKVVPESRKPLVGAFAVQAGHLIWFLFAAIFLNVYGPVAVDIVVLTIGITWLLAAPGIIPVLICGIYQVIGLGINIVSIGQAPFGSVPHRALVVHIAFRLLAILLLVVGLRTYRKKRAQAEAGAQVPVL